uniref:F-box associated beta-propeller type 1 domain-containing protein n=1 Tax=Arundo donax TaxID=35708 RepID=A0A0A9F4M0_ARUDO
MLVYSSCNGLLLLTCLTSRDRAIYYVCNPLTKKLISIGLPKECLSCLSLAFDPSKSRHYKVVALGDMYEIHVYSSETWYWRMAVHSDYSASLFKGLCPIRGVFWNGSVVWIVAHSLVRFVIEGELVTKMPMPPRKTGFVPILERFGWPSSDDWLHKGEAHRLLRYPRDAGRSVQMVSSVSYRPQSSERTVPPHRNTNVGYSEPSAKSN